MRGPAQGTGSLNAPRRALNETGPLLRVSAGQEPFCEGGRYWVRTVSVWRLEAWPGLGAGAESFRCDTAH